MLLNNNYYQTLWDKFKDNATVTSDFKDNATRLTVNLVLEHYRHNKPIHINFQNSKDLLFEVARHLFIELANDIYLNHTDFPNLVVGKTILRDKRTYVDGKRKDYLLKGILADKYVLFDKKNSIEIRKSYDELLKNFITIEQGVLQKTISSYIKYFEVLNEERKSDFTPTNFDTNSVFIAKRPLWDNLTIKAKIPSTYIPNPRDDSNSKISRSIEAIADCMIYFTPKYEVCYQQILVKEKKVKTIVIFDTEGDKIQQILQDKAKFGFNVIVLSNSINPIKNTSIPCWNWFKEELKIVNEL